jgi:RimJ/RimL family protein N-acetyltransferase
LREVEPSDLEVFYHHQQDTESNELAKVYPRERGDHNEHWARILVNPEVIVRTIVFNGDPVGNINVFRVEDEWFVGYWVGRAHWGNGIATRALVAMLEIADARPLLTRVASENIGSIRVLERCGFIKTGEHDSDASERFMACTEAWFELK